jgi:hypothetical protein
MKRNLGVHMLLLSILLTTIGSVFKVMRQITISEILLGAGVVLFVVSIGLIVYNMARRKAI